MENYKRKIIGISINKEETTVLDIISQLLHGAVKNSESHGTRKKENNIIELFLQK